MVTYCKQLGHWPEKLNPRSANLVLVQRLTYLAVLAERKPDLLLAEVAD